MNTGIIHNGDHAEFEIRHANTPKEDRPDWPLPSFDARDWGAAFCKIAKTKGHEIDEDWMVSWFANALMCGFDEATRRRHVQASFTLGCRGLPSMNTSHEDEAQYHALLHWYSGKAESRRRTDKPVWRELRPAFLLLVLSLLCFWVAFARAAGTVTETKSVLLQRSGVTQTPNPASITECLARMAEMIDAELKSRTTGYITYKCLDVSQSYVKFAKAPAVANRAPTIGGTPASTATVGQVYTFTPTASDPDGDKLTFVVDNRPPWATFDTATGKLSGTPTSSDIGVRSEIRIRVQDGKGGEATLAFGRFETVAASTANLSATLSWTPPTQNTDGTALTDLAGYKIVYGTASTALTQTISVPASVSTYVVDNLAPATYYFAVRAVNAAGVESANSSIASKSIP